MTRRQVLFVGFSFLDPAIRGVFRAIERKIGLAHKGRHVALIPNDADDAFVRGLARHNIKHLGYDPANNHTLIWDCFDHIDLNQSKVAAVQKEVSAEPFELARKYLAACYTRTRMKGGVAPLYRAVIEGMVGQIIRTGGRQGIHRKEVIERLARELKTAEAKLIPIADDAVGALQREDVIRVSQDTEQSTLVWVRDTGDPLEDAIKHLVSETINRFIVREGRKDSAELRDALKEFFVRAGVQRGWDLGAAFSAGRSAQDIEVDRLVRVCCSHLDAVTQEWASPEFPDTTLSFS